MAVSIDRWAPGAPKPQPRRRVAAVCRSDASRDSLAFRRYLRADQQGRRSAPSRTRPQEPQPGAFQCRDWRRSHSEPTVGLPKRHGATRFSASSALWVWLACGLVLTLTCPPIAAAQTWFGALPLWLVGLPAASLAVVMAGNAGK